MSRLKVEFEESMPKCERTWKIHAYRDYVVVVAKDEARRAEEVGGVTLLTTLLYLA